MGASRGRLAQARNASRTARSRWSSVALLALGALAQAGELGGIQPRLLVHELAGAPSRAPACR